MVGTITAAYHPAQAYRSLWTLSLKVTRNTFNESVVRLSILINRTACGSLQHLGAVRCCAARSCLDHESYPPPWPGLGGEASLRLVQLRAAPGSTLAYNPYRGASPRGADEHLGPSTAQRAITSRQLTAVSPPPGAPLTPQPQHPASDNLLRLERRAACSQTPHLGLGVDALHL